MPLAVSEAVYPIISDSTHVEHVQPAKAEDRPRPIKQRRVGIPRGRAPGRLQQFEAVTKAAGQPTEGIMPTDLDRSRASTSDSAISSTAGIPVRSWDLAPEWSRQGAPIPSQRHISVRLFPSRSDSPAVVGIINWVFYFSFQEPNSVISRGRHTLDRCPASAHIPTHFKTYTCLAIQFLPLPTHPHPSIFSVSAPAYFPILKCN